MTLAQIIEELKALAAAQAQFSQADIDQAVANQKAEDQIAMDDLKAQVAAMPGQIHDAVVQEDARVAQAIKPLVDQLAALFAP